MNYYCDDPAPYNFIGVQTTLPGKTRRRSNPIGFIWPKPRKKPTQPVKRGKR